MAKQKPSDRRRSGLSTELDEPDLTPIMNLTFMLILSLLTMASMLPLGLITVQAPQLGGGASAAPPPEGEPEKKLNLTIFIKLDGFNIAASGATLDGSTATPPRPGEPLYPKIKKGDKMVYDFEALTDHLTRIKKAFRREESVIIVADPDVAYVDVVDTMDAARENKDEAVLFPAVAFSPGILG